MKSHPPEKTLTRRQALSIVAAATTMAVPLTGAAELLTRTRGVEHPRPTPPTPREPPFVLSF